MSRERQVWITGLGLVCPAGDTAEALNETLETGQSALGPVELFATDGLPALPVGEVRGFDAAVYLGAGNLRPLDRTARLAAAAAARALESSGWTPELRREHELGLVLGTMFGSVHTISEFDQRALTAGPVYAKPMDFANSVINAAAGQTAIWHDLRGVNSTISGGSASGLQALAYAADLVRSGRAGALLAGGAEELCFASMLGFARTGRLAGTGDEPARPIPFHPRRNGFALAEGAALLVLEDAERARWRGARSLARLTGSGNCFDPSRGADDASAAGALVRAARLALDEAELTPADIDVVSASANGSPAGDRQEARAFAELFSDHAASPSVIAVKACLGEPLGAGGALQTLALVGSFAGGRVAALAGLGDQAAEVSLDTQGRRGVFRRGLVTSLGLDGNACALVLEAPTRET